MTLRQIHELAHRGEPVKAWHAAHLNAKCKEDGCIAGPLTASGDDKPRMWRVIIVPAVDEYSELHITEPGDGEPFDAQKFFGEDAPS